MRTLTHKQRVLLKVVERLADKGNSSRFMLVKTLFLLAIEENMGRLIKFYNFFPYKFGPFSNVCDSIKGTNLPVSLKIKRVINKFNSDHEIREYVYKNYEDYTIKSEIIPHAKTQNLSAGVFTIGYEACI
jgi:uncharacterized protein (DUF488 family)